MKWTALEWRKEINSREYGTICHFLEGKMEVRRTESRLSLTLAGYPEEAQERIMARMRLEIEPTVEVDEDGGIK